MKKSKDSIMFIAQGAFRGMAHEVYLMLSHKREEKQSKIGHLASVILLIRLVGRRIRVLYGSLRVAES